ncbi:Mesa protein [Mycena venus]|uniref:Mesa protein n=1 Tax=Mycena venus TaxID=2733690 RepID=A0A8H7CKV4_9AGAR|nr:Mesa protein [Mycena venus]
MIFELPARQAGADTPLDDQLAEELFGTLPPDDLVHELSRPVDISLPFVEIKGELGIALDESKKFVDLLPRVPDATAGKRPALALGVFKKAKDRTLDAAPRHIPPEHRDTSGLRPRPNLLSISELFLRYWLLVPTAHKYTPAQSSSRYLPSAGPTLVLPALCSPILLAAIADRCWPLAPQRSNATSPLRGLALAAARPDIERAHDHPDQSPTDGHASASTLTIKNLRPGTHIMIFSVLVATGAREPRQGIIFEDGLAGEQAALHGNRHYPNLRSSHFAFMIIKLPARQAGADTPFDDQLAEELLGMLPLDELTSPSPFVEIKGEIGIPLDELKKTRSCAWVRFGIRTGGIIGRKPEGAPDDSRVSHEKTSTSATRTFERLLSRSAGSYTSASTSVFRHRPGVIDDFELDLHVLNSTSITERMDLGGECDSERVILAIAIVAIVDCTSFSSFKEGILMRNKEREEPAVAQLQTGQSSPSEASFSLGRSAIWVGDESGIDVESGEAQHPTVLKLEWAGGSVNVKQHLRDSFPSQNFCVGIDIFVEYCALLIRESGDIHCIRLVVGCSTDIAFLVIQIGNVKTRNCRIWMVTRKNLPIFLRYPFHVCSYILVVVFILLGHSIFVLPPPQGILGMDMPTCTTFSKYFGPGLIIRGEADEISEGVVKKDLCPTVVLV